jgi:hypothetical protein
MFHTAPLWATLTNPNWRAVMEKEVTALFQNKTWDLVPQPSVTNVVSVSAYVCGPYGMCIAHMGGGVQVGA